MNSKSPYILYHSKNRTHVLLTLYYMTERIGLFPILNKEWFCQKIKDTDVSSLSEAWNVQNGLQLVQPTALKSEIQRAPELIHVGLQVLSAGCQYAAKVIS